ncbi:MAG: CopG family transcriptional regulator [bacterium]|nr:CopG family transcriptional regulator [bacterium]
MTTPRTYRTRTGQVLTDGDVARIADEVETTKYDIEELKTRRRGRPLLGRAPSEVVTVRINPELRAAISDRAEKDGTTVSAIHREALRRFLLQP